MSTVESRLERIEQLLAQLGDQVAVGTPRWLGVSAAATYAGLGEKTIRQLLSCGKLTAHRPVRGRIVIDRHELDGLITNATNDIRGGRGSRSR